MAGGEAIEKGIQSFLIITSAAAAAGLTSQQAIPTAQDIAKRQTKRRKRFIHLQSVQNWISPFDIFYFSIAMLLSCSSRWPCHVSLSQFPTSVTDDLPQLPRQRTDQSFNRRRRRSLMISSTTANSHHSNKVAATLAIMPVMYCSIHPPKVSSWWPWVCGGSCGWFVSKMVVSSFFINIFDGFNNS